LIGNNHRPRAGQRIINFKEVSMRKMLTAISLLPVSCWAWAAGMEDAASAQPVEVVSGWYVALFLLLFFGMIVGFFAYLWWNEKRKTHQR